MARLNRIDLLAGLFIILIGVLSIIESLHFDMGSARRMGPGYFPFYVGVFMMLVGGGVIYEGRRPLQDATAFGQTPRLRSLLLILAAVVVFAAMIERFGLLPSMAVTVFITALADHRTSMKQRLALAVAVPIVSVLIFKIGLGMQVDIVRWEP